MNTPQVTSIFVLLVLGLVTTGYVSSNPRHEAEATPVQPAERYAQDAHLTYYEQHLVNLGIDRLNCR